MEYLDGASQACAIEIDRVVRLPAVELADLRARHTKFRPPQSYMFLGERHDVGLRRLVAHAWEQAAPAN